MVRCLRFRGSAPVLAAGLLACACRAVPPRPAPRADPGPADALDTATAEARSAFEQFLVLKNAGRLDTPEGAALLEGELAQGGGKQLFEVPGSCDRIQVLDERHAVARVTFQSPASAVDCGGLAVQLPAREVDSYWFLAKSDHWRVGACRALAQTGLLELFLATAGLAEDADEPSWRGTENARLTLGSDRELAGWFHQHSREIEALVRAARELAQGARPASFAASSALGPRLGALRLTSLDLDEHGGVEIVIGGLADNLVCLRLTPDGAQPRMSPKDVIWSEALGDGWFLVRTT